MHTQNVTLFFKGARTKGTGASDSNPNGDPAISQEGQPLPARRHACTPRAANVQLCLSKLPTREQAYHSITDTHSLGFS